MNNNSREHKKLSEKLTELLNILGIYGDELHEKVFQAYTKARKGQIQENDIWQLLCEAAPDLAYASLTDRNTLLELLEREYDEPKPKGKNKDKKNARLSLDEIEKLPDSSDDNEICNYVVYKKQFNGHPEQFFVKVHLNGNEIKKEQAEPRSIPIQTAPSPDFYTKEYGTLKDLFYELRTIHNKYVVYKDEIYATLSGLVSIVSFFREVFYTFPYPDFLSPEPECGKTTAMKVMVFTGFYGNISASFTEALMFREIDESHCFYGLDNVERLFGKGEDYQPIIDWLNSSYSRDIPCKRLEKQGEKFIVRQFDGYGMKAFTHVRDFPAKHRTLKSRTIPMVMQKGKPELFYPTPEKFVDIRDKQYNARLREFDRVRATYEELIKSNILSGRSGDLYYPLLTIAKLVDKETFQKVLTFAKNEGSERTEYDEYNLAIIKVLVENCLYGTHSSQDIKPYVIDKLREEGILRDKDNFTTQQVTNRLKRLGFKRDSRKTRNKAWFVIPEKQVSEKAIEYNLIPPENANFSNISNFPGYFERGKEESTERGVEKEQSTENTGSEVRNLSKSEKSEKSELKGGMEGRGKNVCDRCGKDAQTTLHNAEQLCEDCLNEELEREGSEVEELPSDFDKETGEGQ